MPSGTPAHTVTSATFRTPAVPWAPGTRWTRKAALSSAGRTTQQENSASRPHRTQGQACLEPAPRQGAARARASPELGGTSLRTGPPGQGCPKLASVLSKNGVTAGPGSPLCLTGWGDPGSVHGTDVGTAFQGWGQLPSAGWARGWARRNQAPTVAGHLLLLLHPDSGQPTGQGHLSPSQCQTGTTQAFMWRGSF